VWCEGPRTLRLPVRCAGLCDRMQCRGGAGGRRLDPAGQVVARSREAQATEKSDYEQHVDAQQAVVEPTGFCARTNALMTRPSSRARTASLERPASVGNCFASASPDSCVPRAPPRHCRPTAPCFAGFAGLPPGSGRPSETANRRRASVHGTAHRARSRSIDGVYPFHSAVDSVGLAGNLR
jgi:hypothetical protein